MKPIKKNKPIRKQEKSKNKTTGLKIPVAAQVLATILGIFPLNSAHTRVALTVACGQACVTFNVAVLTEPPLWIQHGDQAAGLHPDRPS